MILKLRTGGPAPGGGWLFVDHVERAQTVRPLVDGDGPVDQMALGDGRRAFRSQADLAQWVDQAYGPSEVRVFSDELWPEFRTDNDCREVVAVRLELERGDVLALLADDAFLLSDGGDTIERLR